MELTKEFMEEIVNDYNANFFSHTKTGATYHERIGSSIAALDLNLNGRLIFCQHAWDLKDPKSLPNARRRMLLDIVSMGMNYSYQQLTKNFSK